MNIPKELRVKHLCIGPGMCVREVDDAMMLQMKLILTDTSHSCVIVVDADGIKNMLSVFETLRVKVDIGENIDKDDNNKDDDNDKDNGSDFFYENNGSDYNDNDNNNEIGKRNKINVNTDHLVLFTPNNNEIK